MKLTKKQIDNGLTTENAFDLFMETLCPSLKTYDYFVNWDESFSRLTDFQSEMEILNQLVGEDDFDSKFLKLLEEHPGVVRALPALLVRTDTKIVDLSIAEVTEDQKVIQRVFDFRVFADTPELRMAALEFVKATGLSRVFQSCNNLHDYLLGVEAGVGSHARKNRIGKKMEEIVEKHLEEFSGGHAVKYVQQATQKKLAKELDLTLDLVDQGRRFDFVVVKDSNILCIEVNYYGTAGTKLKATAAEYKALAERVRNDGYEFLWLTDGPGWVKTRGALQEAFDSIDYIWNLDWLSKGYLCELFE